MYLQIVLSIIHIVSEIKIDVGKCQQAVRNVHVFGTEYYPYVLHY